MLFPPFLLKERWKVIFIHDFPCQFKAVWSISPNTVIFCNAIENSHRNWMKGYVLHISSEKAAATMTKEEGASTCKSNDFATDIHSSIRVKGHIADRPSCMVSVKGDNWRNFFLTLFSLSLEVGLSCPCQLTQVQLLGWRSSPALSSGSPPASCCLHCVHRGCAWLVLLSCQYQSNKHGTTRGAAGMVQNHSIIKVHWWQFSV